MKKLLALLVVGIFIITVFGASSTAQEDTNFEVEKINLKLENPIINQGLENCEINLENTNSFIMEPGKPILPCYRETFKYPLGTEIIDINLNIREKEKIKLNKDIKIAPQPVKIKSLTTDKQITQKAVKLKNPYPSEEISYNLGRGIENGEATLFLTIQVNPCMYNPKESTVTIAKNIEVSIVVKKQLTQNNQEDLYNFLILSPSKYSDELEDLVTHKISKGINTKLVTLGYISSEYYFPNNGRDEIENIKLFIKNAYDNWGTRNVLIVGGADDFPARETHIKVLNKDDPDESDDEVFLSDLYYADLYDGENNFVSWDSNGNNIFAEINQDLENDTIDLYPDVRIGRLACTDEEEVTTVVNKIINYENSEAWTKNWFNNIVVIGGDTVPSHYGDDTNIDEGELVNQAVLDVMDGFIPDKIWDSNRRLSSRDYNTGVDNIDNGVDKGCGFIDWSGHGAPHLWTTFPHNGRRQILPTPFGSYGNSNIQDLENGDMLPIVMCGGCSLGKYKSNDNCFSWAYLSNPNGGGIASFGASALGYVYLGPYATFALVEGLMLKFYEAYEDNAFTLGEMWSDAYNNYINQIINLENVSLSAVDYKTLTEVHMFGDPTLQVRGDSQAPNKPTNLEGPEGELEKNIEYEYSALTTDLNNDQIYYLFEWGDGTYSEWLGPYDSGDQVKEYKTWTEGGDFEIRVKAKDIFGVQSEWSDPLNVNIPKQKSYRFPLIERIILFLEKYFPNIDNLLK